MDRGVLWAAAAGEPSGTLLPIAVTETTVQNAGRTIPQSPSVGFAVVIAALLVGIGAAVVRHHDSGHEAATHQEAPDRSEAEQDSRGERTEDVPRTDASLIEGLLDDQGGRMRQTEIVHATGWSKSKVSLLLKEMEAAGRIRKVRIGRENLVLLPGAEPDAVLGDDDG